MYGKQVPLIWSKLIRKHRAGRQEICKLIGVVNVMTWQNGMNGNSLPYKNFTRLIFDEE